MGSSQIYNLTWGEYGSSLISAVQHLRRHGELTDVTLAAEGRTFHAHKVVLCAASPFLFDLLKSTTSKHPVVMLVGVQAADLEALLEFVYTGEVSIEEDQLPSLLQAAHCLNIQGLTTSSNLNSDSIRQQTMKSGNQELKTQTAAEIESPLKEELPFKQKKRPKLGKSLPIAEHDKCYVPTTIANDEISSSSEPLWAHHMSIINLTTPTIDSLSNQSPVLVQTAPTSFSSSVSGQSSIINISATKMKGASDQPGVCPLCGALLRQARNLRRHLVTSCKYRMLNGSPHFNRDFTHLQSGAVPDMDKTTQNRTDALEEKSFILMPITCAELISSNNSASALTSTIQ